MPPLRDRRADIPLLIGSFLEDACKRAGQKKVLSTEALDALLRHTWPGNVRELRNTIERLVVSSRGSLIEAFDLTDTVTAVPPAPQDQPFSDLPTLDDLERRYLLHVLDAANGNRTRAAEILGVDRRTLYRMAERFGIALKSRRSTDVYHTTGGTAAARPSGNAAGGGSSLTSSGPSLSIVGSREKGKPPPEKVPRDSAIAFEKNRVGGGAWGGKGPPGGAAQIVDTKRAKQPTKTAAGGGGAIKTTQHTKNTEIGGGVRIRTRSPERIVIVHERARRTVRRLDRFRTHLRADW